MSSGRGPSSPATVPPSTSSTIPSKPSTSSSDLIPDPASVNPICAICTSNPARYTCPRCKLRTCSLSCSATHKSVGEGCSGIRNKAAYVPMNQYGYMALMDDYAFLEEVGRKVTEAGKEIAVGGYQNSVQAQSEVILRGGRGRGRGRGRAGRGHGPVYGRGAYHRGGNNSRRDILRMELDFRDIEMDMLPVGMEKRALNQSTWDSTLNTALLTVEFVFHPPPDPYALSTQTSEPPVTILTHRNGLGETIGQCVQAKVAERAKSKKDKQVPQWLQDLITPDPSDLDSFQAPMCVMPTLVDPLVSLQSRATAMSLRPGHIKRHGHYKLDINHTLEVALRHKQFVEYPTIELWEKDAFTGIVVDDGGTVVHDDADEHKPKRRKLGVKEGKKAISGLLGDYGSDQESEDGENTQEEKNVFQLLAGYAGSEDEGDTKPPLSSPLSSVPAHYLNDDELGDEDAEGETDDEMAEEVSPEELAAMLESLRQAGAFRNTTGHGQLPVPTVDEDQIDWGDSEVDG